MRIDTRDISVVIQGAVNEKWASRGLRSIRKFLPEAEIILSTWKGTAVSGLDYDILVLNEDPGAEKYTSNGKHQNQNRQILSTLNGIKRATRKYVLKLRADMKLEGTRFLSFFDKYHKYNPQYKILKNRILINSLYTRHSEITPWNTKPFLFHVSDWMMFGLREDMLNIWDIPLAPEPQTSQYFLQHPEIPHDNGCYTRYHAEQYIWLSFLRKNGIDPNYEHWEIYNKELKDLHDLILVNNTVLLEYRKEFDIVCQKYPAQMGDSPTMHPVHWLALYQKYCDPAFVFPLKYRWMDELHIRKYWEHFLKHWRWFAGPIGAFLRWLDNLWCGIYYFIRMLLSALYYMPRFIYREIKRKK